jgi:hypothetical protein
MAMAGFLAIRFQYPFKDYRHFDTQLEGGRASIKRQFLAQCLGISKK